MVAGVLGFIPGITARYGEMMFLGPDSHAMLLGLFQVSMLLNIVQLVIGATGWAMSRDEMGARRFLMGAGALYIILSIYGLSVGVDSAANFLSLNMHGQLDAHGAGRADDCRRLDVFRHPAEDRK